MNGTNLTHGKIWQHGRSTDCNTQDMSFHWDMKKKFNYGWNSFRPMSF